MDENNNTLAPDTMEVEMESAWDNENDSWESEAEPEVNQQTEQREAAPAPETTGDQTATNQTQQALENQQEPYMIPYEFMGEKKQLAASEAAPYIQKGMHYDAVRQERDQLRQYREQNAAAVDFLTRHAMSQGMTVNQYLEQMQKQELMRRGLSDVQADQQIQFQKEKAQVEADKRAIEAFRQTQNSAQQAQQKKQADFRQGVSDLLKAYPDLKPEAIPKEVWAKVGQGVPLLNAYTMHENAQLKAQLAAAQQNKANQQRSPGGLGGNAAAELDEMDRLWNEDD